MGQENFRPRSRRKKRVVSYDVVRAFAAVVIVLCHCLEQAYTFDITDWEQMPFRENLFRIVAHSIAGTGVPLLLFLTGALVLSKNIEEDKDVLRFYRRNLFPLALSAMIWVVIYRIYLYVTIGQTTTVFGFIKELLLIDQISKMIHMWYMPVIIGIYFSIPFAAKAIKNISVKSLGIVLVFIFILESIIPTINVFLDLFEKPTIHADWSSGYTAGLYGLYIVLGYLISKGLLRKWSTIACLVTAMLSMCLLVAMHIFVFSHGKMYKIWYDNTFVIIVSAMLFELILRKKHYSAVTVKVTRFLSIMSLAIYYLHLLVIKSLNSLIPEGTFTPHGKSLLLWVVATPLTVGIIWALSHIRVIREKVFLYKG